MRIYEFAKQQNLSVKEVMDILQGGGFHEKSHMAILTDDAHAFLQKKVASHGIVEKNDVQKSTVEKVEKKVVDTSTKVSSEGVRIEARGKKDQVSKIDKQKNAKHVTKSPIASVQKQNSNIADPSKEKVPFMIKAMSVSDFAVQSGKPANDVIITLLRWGTMATKNQMISADVVKKLVHHYGIEVPEHVANERTSVSAVSRPVLEESADVRERAPIVAVVGHVDHGKTTLLDFIRKTRIASREKGGITQHIGAYQAQTKKGETIVFLDTPGHEAFSKIRQRGVRVADIVVLVVAADDGVMPQTVEAIKHIKASHVPVIVAVNKIDKTDLSRVDTIKKELARYDIISEDWGGDVVFIPLSAKTGSGVDSLLEMIILQAHMMELRASQNGKAKGVVLEAKIEKGHGPVATIISQHGSMHLNDYFACGNTVGRITSLINSFGENVRDVAPAIPVQVAGFEALPLVGDFFHVIDKKEYLEKRQDKKTEIKANTSVRSQEGLNLIIKTDSNATKEALVDLIEGISKKQDDVFYIIHAAAGDINESDIELAYNTGATIQGLHVKVEPKAAVLAQNKGVKIELFDIIYRLTESLEARVKKSAPVEMVRTKIGEANVLKVFDIKSIGVIAGSYVKTGRFVKGAHVVVFRNKHKVGEGVITSLQRDKKVVKEVHSGFECGFVTEGFADWMENDHVDCYIEMPKK